MTEVAARDQDVVKNNKAGVTSKRSCSVWNRTEHGSYDSTCGSALSTDDFRTRREDAARWLQTLTGTTVPFATDLDFRKALSNGVVLCKALNAVVPDTVKVLESEDEVGPTMQRYENVQNFIKALSSLGVPQDAIFSVADLESQSNDEKPRVAECVLWLKSSCEGRKSPLHGIRDDTMPASDSPQKRSLVPMSGRGSFRSQGSPVLGQFASSPASMQHRGMQDPAGVHKLMQQCTMILQEKMSVAVNYQVTRQSPGASYDAVGPVLESVLGGLTQEYERRLLTKDQEIQATKDKIGQMQAKMDVMSAKLSQMRQQLEDQQTQAAAAAVAADAAATEALQTNLAQVEAALQDRELLLSKLQAQLEGAAGVEAEKVAELEQQLHEASSKLQYVESIELKYKQALEDNKQLYNQVQDLKGSIRVFCRIRPLGKTGDFSHSCVDVGNERELATYDSKGERKVWKFDHVFGMDSTQEAVYADTQPLIRSVLDGYNVCIFAYGQTGSGKTHTMSGTHVENLEGRGINYRTLDDLFALRAARADEVDYTITVQMVEVYNEKLRDLLVDSTGGTQLEFMSTRPSGCNIKGVVQIPVYDTDDVIQMMARGARNRHMAETKMNERSSRSHQVLTIIVGGVNKVTGARSHACLHLVDLAGSERTSKSGAEGDRMTEAKHINKSLSSLGDVMAALASKQVHVPYRNSMLTQLLADSLSGQAKVMMFVHVAPEASSMSESQSTLQFATRVSDITLGQAKKNVESGEVYKAHEEMHTLRQKLTCVDNERAALLQRIDEERREKEALMLELEQLRRTAQATPMQPAVSGTTYASVQSEAQSVQSRHMYVSPMPMRTPGGAPLLSPLALHAINEKNTATSVTPMSARSHSTFKAGLPKPAPASNRAGGTYRGSTSPPQAAVAGAARTGTGRPTAQANSTQRTSYATSSARQGSTFGGKTSSALPTATSRASGVFNSKTTSVVKTAQDKPSVPQSAGGRRSTAGGTWARQSSRNL